MSTPPVLAPARLSIWRAIGLALMVQVMQGVVVAAVFVPMLILKGRPTGEPHFPISVFSLATLGGAGTAIALGWRRSGLPWRALMPLRVTRGQALAGVFLCVGCSFALAELGNLLVAFLPLPSSWLTTSAVSGLNMNPVELFVAGAFLAPIGEELVFRGVILRRLASGYGPKIALVVSALLFGVSHVFPVLVVATTMIGLVFGWIYLRTGSLAIPIAGHIANNLVGVSLDIFGVKTPGLSGTPVAGELHLLPWWVDTLAIVFVVVGAVKLARATSQPVT